MLHRLRRAVVRPERELLHGRIRIRQIERPDQASLVSFVQDSVSPLATPHTDGSQTYRIFQQLGYRLDQTVHLTSGKPAHETMPGVHRVAALLQRWRMGTHQGAVQPTQLDYYLDEFVFRFNRRMPNSKGLLF